MGEVSAPLPIWNYERTLSLSVLELSQGRWNIVFGQREGLKTICGSSRSSCLSCMALRRTIKARGL